MNELDLFAAAIAIADPGERAAMLDQHCAGRPDLRQRIEQLLEAHFRPNPLLDQREPANTGADGDPDAMPAGERSTVESAGTVIAGKYSLVEMIGEGGMGSVWRAKQTEPVKRFVAVKLIKAGMDSKSVLARFEAERQALALMDHPNISRVLDGGLHEHRPFFVMELIKGVPITEYCDRCKLTPKERLELFVPVCQAIQHAHQKGIIHRDIKPRNVLIALYDDKPVVKVIDFGVAKATGGTLTERTIDTGFGAVVGTPQYMSPEQATFNNLDIDTRSDVYTLGVLLYELLTGSPPFSRKELEKKGLLEILRVVREEEPPRPSVKLSTADALPTLSANRRTEPRKLTALLRNELDWIVMKALEKERTRRYETANGFAADVLRYLGGEPVMAHPASTAYRLRKFVRRHRGQVLAAALVLLALLAGITGTTLGLIEARQAMEREAARADGEEKARVAAVEAQKRAEAAAKAETTAKEAEAAERAKAVAEKEKAVVFRNQALDALRATTGEDVEKLLGEKKELSATEKAYLEAIAGRWQAFARDEGTDEQSRAVRAEGHARVAYLWAKLGRREESLLEFERAVALQEKLAADFPTVPAYRSDLAQSHNNLGTQLAHLGKRAEGEEQLHKALAIQKKLAADFPTVPEYCSALAGSHGNLGTLLADLGKRAEAEEQHQKALAIQKKLAADFPTVPKHRSDQARSHNNLGGLLADLGKWADAEEQYRKALAIVEKLAADFPTVPEYRSNLARNHISLGNLLADLGKRAEAEEQYQKGLAILEKLAADFPTLPEYRNDQARSHINLGNLLKGLGKRVEAEEQYKKALAILEKLAAELPTVPEYRSALAISHYNLGNLMESLGKRAEAEEQYQRALAIQAKLAADFPTVPEYRSVLAHSHNNLGNLMAGLGKRADAEGHYQKALAIRAKLAADFPAILKYRVDLGGSYCNLGNLVRDGRKPADSLTWYQKAIDTLGPVHEQDSRATTAKLFLRNSHEGRANAYQRLEQYAEAVKDWDRAIHLSAQAERAVYRGHLAACHHSLGLHLKDLGKRTEAQEQFQKALALQAKLAADFPTVPEYRSELAAIHHNLAVLLGGLDKRAAAEEQFQKALTLQAKLADDFPTVPKYRIALGGTYGNLGNLVLLAGKPADSLAWYQKAIDTLGPVHEHEPRDVARFFLGKSHEGRASAYQQLEQYAEAVKDWDRAILFSAKAEQLGPRAKRADSQVRAGQVAEAVAEVAALTKTLSWNAGQWYDFACIYAIAAGKVADKKQEYSDRAMELLHKAVTAGFDNATHMKRDADLDRLRERDDFKKLLAELEKKDPPKKAPEKQ